MIIKDKIKLALTLYLRDKKKILYSLIIFICCLVSILTILYGQRCVDFFLDTFTSVSYRTYSIGNSLTQEEADIAISEISNIEHIIDAYYGYPPEISMTLNDGYNVSYTLLERRIPDALPKIIYGRKYKEDESNVMVCSIDLVNPNVYDEVFINEKINMKKYLNTEVEIEYEEYDYGENGKQIVSDKHKEKFTLVGFFRSYDDDGATDICFVNKNDSDRLFNNSYSKYIENQKKYYEELAINGKVVLTASSAPSLKIVLDDNKYLDEVKKELENKGMSSLMRRHLSLDKETIVVTFSVLIIILGISFVMILVISASYSKKKLLREEKNINTMYLEGFNIKDVGHIYALEIIIQHSVIYFIVMIISLIACIVAVNKIKVLYLIGFKANVLCYLITFILIVLVPGWITYRKVLEYNK